MRVVRVHVRQRTLPRVGDIDLVVTHCGREVSPDVWVRALPIEHVADLVTSGATPIGDVCGECWDRAYGQYAARHGLEQE